MAGLGHEVDAAEHDRGGVGTSAAHAGQPERVADEVGDVLDLGNLVVVGEDHRVAFLRQRQHLLLPVVGQHLDVDGRIGHVASVGVVAPAAVSRTPKG